MRKRTGALLGLAAVSLIASVTSAQCRPSAGSNESRLLAFYSVPTAFSPMGAPEYLTSGAVKIGAEIAPIPKPDRSIRQTGACFTSKDENTDLAPVFGRPRITVGLPFGFAVTVSYLPPITIASATPNLGSVAISEVQEFRLGPWIDRSAIMLRAHSTFGSIKGPITCPRTSLQQTNPSAPCNGPTHPTTRFGPACTAPMRQLQSRGMKALWRCMAAPGSTG